MARLPATDKADTVSSRRRAPRQLRSKLTVQSILQATVELAKKEGFLNLGTRRIAERAGVSVGSLYQYFPTVEAILVAIYEETASRVATRFRAKMLSVMHSRMEIVGKQTLRLLLKEYEDNQLILHQMTIELPQLLRAPGVASLDRLLRAGIRIYLMQFSALHEKDIERVSFFLEILVVGSLRNYLSNRPPQLSQQDFLEDLNTIAIGYARSQSLEVIRYRESPPLPTAVKR
jgi:AcrR family transcriptional regulator